MFNYRKVFFTLQVKNFEIVPGGLRFPFIAVAGLTAVKANSGGDISLQPGRKKGEIIMKITHHPVLRRNKKAHDKHGVYGKQKH